MTQTIKKRLAQMLYLALLIWAPVAKLSAQSTVVYSETFTTPDGTISSPNWAIDTTHCLTGASNYHFYVTASALEGRNLGGEAVWRSKTMNIGAYQQTDLSVEVSRSGTLVSTDYVKTYYILNGGTETLFATNGTLTGAFATCIAAQTGLHGTTVQIVVRMYNNSASKKQRIDNATITGTNPVAIPLSASTATTSESCAGRSNGSVTLTINGGTAPYHYVWNNGSTNQNLLAVSEGVYTVTVTDASNSTVITSGTVNRMPGMTTSINAQDLSANINDGVAKLKVTGGIPPYNIVWNNGTATANNYHLTAGTYSVTITDADHCTANASVTLTTMADTKLLDEDFDGLFSNTWQSISFVGNTTNNIWAVTNSPCSLDNYSLQIKDGTSCTYNQSTTQDIITYIPVSAIGFDSLVLKFNWKSLGEPNFDFGSVWYSTDSTNWQQLETGGDGFGIYENSNIQNNESLMLPDSLKNKVFYLGFNWNNDNNLGSNPGFIVDDIVLTGRTYIAGPPRPTCNWTGNANIYWADTLNWDCGHLPLPTDNAVIPGGSINKPMIVKGFFATCYNLTIAAGTGLDMTDGCSLTIYGDLKSSEKLTLLQGIIYMQGDSTQHINIPAASSLHNLVINNLSTTGVVMNSNITIDGTLSLMNGYLVTGNNIMILSNPYPTVPTIDSYSNKSHVVGSIRRYITPNYFSYDFPVGIIGDSSLHTAVILPTDLIGVNYLTASFQPLANNDNRQLIALDNIMPAAYNRICNEGTWVIIPDNVPSSGTYEIQLGTENIRHLHDNLFAVLKRPLGGTAADWGNGNGTLPNDYDAGRTVASGYAKRMGMSDFAEFGIARLDTGINQVLMVGNYNAGHNVVILHWNDSTYGINNTRVLRSFDGQVFAPIFGSSISSNGASFKTSDESPAKGIVFYQLEGTDKDGKKVLSDAIMVNCVGYTDDDLLVFPNPNKGVLNFHLASKETNIDIVVSSLNGEIVSSYSSYVTGPTFDKQIDLTSTLAAGTYLVRVNTDYESFYRKITVTK